MAANWSSANQSSLHRTHSSPGDSRPSRVRQQQSLPNSDTLHDSYGDAMGEQDRDGKDVNDSCAPIPPQRKYLGDNLSFKVNMSKMPCILKMLAWWEEGTERECMNICRNLEGTRCTFSYTFTIKSHKGFYFLTAY